MTEHIWRCPKCGIWGRLMHRYLAPKTPEFWEELERKGSYFTGECNPEKVKFYADRPPEAT
jgi:hypothetical protein